MVFYPHKSGKWAGMKGGDTVLKAITLATPHHGTHGSNDVNALGQYIKFGWRQVIDKLNFAYWSDRTGFFSPQTLASGTPNRGDLRWDNYDGAISANSLTNNDVNIWLPTANKKFEQYASKMILYAGEVRLENIAKSPQSALSIALGTPLYNDHQKLGFANDVLVNGFSNKFGSTNGLVPYKSALLCDTPPYLISPATPNFICGSKYKVRRFEAGETDVVPNKMSDANTLSIKRIRRGYDHKDMYEHPDVLRYVMSDLKEFVKPPNYNPKNQLPPLDMQYTLNLVVKINPDNTLKLNQENVGTVGDAADLSQSLSSIFKERKINGVFREGTSEQETTVWIVVPSDTKYGDISEVVKVVERAGASPIKMLTEKEHEELLYKNAEFLYKKYSTEIKNSGLINGENLVEDRLGIRRLNDKAISLPKPSYPKFAKKPGISESVAVWVVVDEKGIVVQAKVMGEDGNQLLRDASVKAAYLAKFHPVFIYGQLVKVEGMITYDFEP